MSNQANNHFPSSDEEALERLLAKDAEQYPIQESPWFASRTAAIAHTLPQQGSSYRFFALPNLRWLLPIPLAGFAAMAFFLTQHPSSSPRTFSSSESEFEQHIEMLTSSDSTQDYLVSQ